VFNPVTSHSIAFEWLRKWLQSGFFSFVFLGNWLIFMVGAPGFEPGTSCAQVHSAMYAVIGSNRVSSNIHAGVTLSGKGRATAAD
jgi:hypothetical protein